MGKLNDLLGQKIYLDTNIFIYALEQNPEYAAVVDRLFALFDAAKAAAFTSEIALAECLVKPCADGNSDFQIRYQAAITTRPGLTVYPISRSMIIRAAHIRAAHKVRLPDAIHLATALDASCDFFLTNDQLVKPIPGITLIQLSDLYVGV
ncbi:MAG: PIN domain-containing protein [Phycisphaerales bacterium]|nr:PIN domain-containing protein [Phycisphaerales bacterium]